ncbi:MAG TPA: hypothetical protein VMW17_20470, partial [Candidatus Binatia bacterium]|nr:hypothetical protein [Candidatus Binatia bacterium]
MSLIPKAEFGGYPYSFLDACNNMSQWPNVLSVTSDLGSFVADLNAGDDSSLSTCFSNMQEAGLELTIEAAAVQPGGCGGGVGCYNSLASTLTRMINLGAPAIRIRLQEPLTD